MISAFS